MGPPCQFPEKHRRVPARCTEGEQDLVKPLDRRGQTQTSYQQTRPMADPEKFSLEIKRFVSASRDRIYAAWTDPAQLKEWFGPENVKTRDLVADVRVGGQFRWDCTDPEGNEVTITGEYRELEAGRRIVFTWKHEGNEDWKNITSIVTVEFVDCEGGTEIHLTHEKLPTETSRDDHEQGWNSVFDRLGKFLNK